MRIGISTSVIQRGRTGIAKYLFGLLRAFVDSSGQHEFVLFVLEDDLPLFGFAGISRGYPREKGEIPAAVAHRRSHVANRHDHPPVPDGNGGNDRSRPDFARPRVQFVAVPEAFRPPVRDIFWHQTVLPRLARRYRLDVLHVPSYRRLPGVRPCALVATVHDLAPFRIPRKYNWPRMLYGRVVARLLARRQHEIIAVSRNTATDLRTLWKLPAQCITVVHNGLDHQVYSAGERSRSGERTRRRWRLDEPFFLYVGRLEHPAKNHVRLIQAFERFKAESGSRWRLVFAGSDWHGADAIHAAIRGSPVSADIRCLGFVPEAELPGLYHAAAVFVYPSLYEGFGFPPLEAMACGCPVLCSSRGALGEVVGSAAAIVEPESIADLKRQLGVLAADTALRERMRVGGLARAQQFDWGRAAEATLRVYAQALETAAPEGRRRGWKLEGVVE